LVSGIIEKEKGLFASYGKEVFEFFLSETVVQISGPKNLFADYVNGLIDWDISE
jgi:hypothetical protein